MSRRTKLSALLQVKRFISGEDMYMLRQRRRLQGGKSSFVRFFETLQDRCPLPQESPGREWMRKVRAQMTKAGIWPTGADEFDIEFVIEYVQRLMAAFWDTVGFHNFEPGAMENFLRDYNDCDKRRLHRRLRKTFQVIYSRIRRWGLQGEEKKFHLHEWHKYVMYHPVGLGHIWWDWKHKTYNGNEYGKHQVLRPFESPGVTYEDNEPSDDEDKTVFIHAGADI